MKVSELIRQAGSMRLAKDILFPGVTHFNQLFHKWAPEKGTTRDIQIPLPSGIGGKKKPIAVITPFMSLTLKGKKSGTAYAELKPEYAEKLKGQLSLDDRLYFQVIQHDSNCVVILKYNKILGDRWLARIDVKSIPENILPEADED